FHRAPARGVRLPAGGGARPHSRAGGPGRHRRTAYRIVKIRHLSRGALVDYVVAQLDHFFPDRRDDPRPVVEKTVDDALARLGRCIDGVRMWRPGEFDHLHSSQYTIFLYYLADTAWHAPQAERVGTQLLDLNKAPHGF